MNSRSAAALPLLLVACPAEPAGPTTSGTDAATSTGEPSTTATATSDSDATPTSTPTSTPTTTLTGEPGTQTDTSDTLVTGDTTTTGSDTGSSTETTGEPLTASSSSGGEQTGSSSTGQPGACTPGESQSCYGGPAGTEDVGECAAGEQLCTPGGEWGPCLGEVLPTRESCDLPGDEDCDGADPCGGTGTYQWSHAFGSGGTENGMRIGFDGAGNLVLAAQATSAVDLGGGDLVGGGNYDLVLGKFAPDGKHVWSKRFGDATNQFNDGFGLHVDAAGEIVVTGDFEGTLDFGGGPLIGQSTGDVFLVKLDAGGAHVWSKAFKAGGYAYSQALTRDQAGNVLLGGYFLQDLELGGGKLVSAGLVDAFVGKFDPDGKHVWSQRFGDPDGQYVLGLAADGAGNVYMGGGFSGVINPGNGQLVSSGGADVFLARLDPKGTAMWGKKFGDPQSQVLRDLTIDALGRITITGEMAGSVDFGGGVLVAPGTRSFVAQYDGAGKHLWSRLLADNTAQARAIATDGLGQLLVTGDFSGKADFGGGALTSEGGADIYAVKLTAGGAHLWSHSFGDFQSQTGYDIAGSVAGSVGVCGGFQGGVNFGGGPLLSKGGFDGFIVRFGP